MNSRSPNNQPAEMRQLRLSETIQPFGVGAIVDINSESFIAMDTSTWDENACPRVSCRPLERELGVFELRQPPTAVPNSRNTRYALPYVRFPRWRFCQDCGAMANRMNHRNGSSSNTCFKCNGPMVPMRFVAVCTTGGHIQDIDWRYWSHFQASDDAQRQCRDYEHLELRTSRGEGEGLRSLRVVCRSCGVARNLGPLGRDKSLHQEGYRCRGLQPWEPQDEPKPCDAELRVVQRGSTSVYQAETTSAIDIPEAESASTELRRKIEQHPLFRWVSGNQEGPMADAAIPQIAEETKAPVTMVHQLLTAESAPEKTRLDNNLHEGEWAAFDRALRGEADVTSEDFVVNASDYPHSGSDLPSLTRLVKDVGLVHRMREVRALRGFSRYEQEDYTRVDLGGVDAIGWYPAIEQFGEGVLLRFDEDAVSSWEQNPAVQSRLQHWLDKGRSLERFRQIKEDLTPRYVMLHSLAHLLMRRLEFQSGYSASSLSERIYASAGGPDPQAGLLIYTSGGDAQGTLGGLVRLGHARYFAGLLLGAIEDSDRCSNNPVCAESRGQGMNSLNLAACHACSLVSETSCERGNIYLDRKLLVGDDTVPGFFRPVLNEARANITT